MANGKLADFGYVACPRNIKLGTRVKILGEVYECGDRLSSRFKDRFDIWFGYGRKAYENALEFGKKRVEVVIL
jgi:3D (Asp-Asp-Asp) domain-containing protein